tara:strand:- start:399 stop:641 length:243 start_codon:yes stop_codon:yes gene_type:complete
MKATGIIKITNELTLKNPTLEICKVSYNWVEQTVDIECLFQEGSFKHNRTFNYSTSGKTELTSSDIIGFIKKDKVLNVFS